MKLSEQKGNCEYRGNLIFKNIFLKDKSRFYQEIQVECSVGMIWQDIRMNAT